MKNPFKFGKVVEKEDFCNREKELKFLKDHIRNRYSVWLYSPRRYGKTSLLIKAFQEIDTVKTVYFDLYNVQSLDDFAKKYATVLTNELFNWMDDIKQFAKKLGQYFTGLYPKISFDSSGNPAFELDVHKIKEQHDIETILNVPENIGLKNNEPVCIAFDEFQEIERIEPFLIHWMRSAFQKQKMVSYIFIGSKQSLMKTIFADVESPFYEFGVKMKLNPISEADLQSFILKKFADTELHILPEHVEDIMEKSRCYPHFTQYFASVVWDLIKEGENQRDPNFPSMWLNKILESQSIIFQNIYDQLNNNHRKVLKALATVGSKVEIFSKSTAMRFDLPGSSTLNETVKSLMKKELINKENSVYEIVNPVFQVWLKRI